MLVKPLAAFTLGAVTVASSISAALGTPGRAGFCFGVLTTVLSVIWALGSSKRQQQAGRFLLRLSGAKPKVAKVQPPLPVAAKVQIRKTDNPIYTDVVLALRGLKTDKETARWAAGQATMRLPDAGFDETFKLAAQIATARA
jgi:hypothetical protein